MEDKGTQQLTYLRTGGGTLGYSTLGHVGTRQDTMPLNGENGTQNGKSGSY